MKPTVYWYEMKDISDKTIKGELASLIMVFAMDSKDKHGSIVRLRYLTEDEDSITFDIQTGLSLSVCFDQKRI